MIKLLAIESMLVAVSGNADAQTSNGCYVLQLPIRYTYNPAANAINTCPLLCHLQADVRIHHAVSTFTLDDTRACVVREAKLSMHL